MGKKVDIKKVIETANQNLSENDFVHLHVHTDFSLLDGAAKINDLVDECVKLNMKALAITDHGNMYGTIAFQDALAEKGIKPIIGCEFYTTSDMHVKDYSAKDDSFHLVLLAKDYEGYLNLVKLDSLAFVEGFYYKPKIDLELLKKHSGGLVCLTACLGGKIPQLLLEDNEEGARSYLKELKEIFGEDLYVEIQDHGMEDQKYTNPKLVKLAREEGVKIVATNDVHYTRKDQSEAHDILLCIQTGKTLNDQDRMRFPSDQFYLKSKEEMEEVFPSLPDSISSSVEIAKKCNAYIQFEMDLIPNYYPENGQTPKEFFKSLIDSGLKKRYPIPSQEVLDRIEYEFDVISKMGFVDYYLIVWDFINYAKEQDIPVGYGRGSGVGSIIAYILGITNVEPLKYQLLFERFLNSERVSMPDFDIDFCFERRGEVVEYVIEKYGAENVSQIITFGTLAARQVFKDVARVYNLPFSDVNKLTTFMPTNPALKVTLRKIFRTDFEEQEKKKNQIDSALKKANDAFVAEETPENLSALEQVQEEADKFYDKIYVDPKLQVKELIDIYQTDETMKKIIDIAIDLEGSPRNTGMHAAGVIICKEKISDFVPLSRSKDDITTQAQKDDCERLGLLKMDFLGLKTLTDIKKCVDYIKEDYGIAIDFDQIGEEDQGAYELIGSGDTDGVFQLESDGMKEFMKKLKPNCMEDIIAGISLYRPGPMKYIDDYIYGKNNKDKIKYDHPSIKGILEPSYGVIVYQEQVMQIVQEMAGYSLGQADIIRRAMGKKKVAEMQIQKGYFVNGKTAEDGTIEIEGALRRGVSKEVAIKVFEKMADFAKYAFNKSHAAAYATISYQTAYLKKYYPVQFLSSILNNRITNLEEISKYTNYAKNRGIEILPPSVNKSRIGFKSEEGNKIRFGLAALKNIGEPPCISILKEREKGEFKDFVDFVTRCHKFLNKRMVESMIKGGALDGLGLRRSQLMTIFDTALDIISKQEKNKVDGQMNFFETVLEDEPKLILEIPDTKEFDTKARLLFEKEVMGLYVSGHLLDDVREILNTLPFNLSMLTTMAEESEEVEESGEKEPFQEKKVIIGGLCNNFQKIMTRSGKDMMTAKLEDIYGTIDLVFFSKTYERYCDFLQEDVLLKVQGRLSKRNDFGYQIIVEKVEFLQEEKPNEEIKENEKKIYVNITEQEVFDRVSEIFFQYRGHSQAVMVFLGKAYKYPYGVKICQELMWELEVTLADECIKIK